MTKLLRVCALLPLLFTAVAQAAPVPIRTKRPAYAVVCKCIAADNDNFSMIRGEDTLKLNKSGQFSTLGNDARLQFLETYQFIADEAKTFEIATEQADRINGYVKTYGAKLEGRPKESLCSGRKPSKRPFVHEEPSVEDTPDDQIFWIKSDNEIHWNQRKFSIFDGVTFKNADGYYDGCFVKTFDGDVEEGFLDWLSKRKMAGSDSQPRK